MDTATQETGAAAVQPSPASPRRPSPADAAALQSTSAPDELREALKAQLQSVLERELTPRSLLELEQLAGLAQRMLIVSGDPRALAKRRRGGVGIMAAGYGTLNPAYDAIGPEDTGELGGAMAPAPFHENFGAESIRHMVAAAEKPKINELFAALEIAQKLEGAEDHVRRLKGQIDERLGAGDSAPNPIRAAAVAAVEATS